MGSGAQTEGRNIYIQHLPESLGCKLGGNSKDLAELAAAAASSSLVDYAYGDLLPRRPSLRVRAPETVLDETNKCVRVCMQTCVRFKHMPTP